VVGIDDLVADLEIADLGWFDLEIDVNRLFCLDNLS